MQAVRLTDSDPTTVRAGEGSNLDTFDRSKDVLLSTNRVEERNLAFVTLEIEIVDHYKTFQLVKKKTA